MHETIEKYKILFKKNENVGFYPKDTEVQSPILDMRVFRGKMAKLQNLIPDSVQTMGSPRQKGPLGPS